MKTHSGIKKIVFFIVTLAIVAVVSLLVSRIEQKPKKFEDLSLLEIVERKTNMTEVDSSKTELVEKLIKKYRGKKPTDDVSRKKDETKDSAEEKTSETNTNIFEMLPKSNQTTVETSEETSTTENSAEKIVSNYENQEYSDEKNDFFLQRLYLTNAKDLSYKRLI